MRTRVGHTLVWRTVCAAGTATIGPSCSGVPPVLRLRSHCGKSELEMSRRSRDPAPSSPRPGGRDYRASVAGLVTGLLGVSLALKVVLEATWEAQHPTVVVYRRCHMENGMGVDTTSHPYH